MGLLQVRLGSGDRLRVIRLGSQLVAGGALTRRRASQVVLLPGGPWRIRLLLSPIWVAMRCIASCWPIASGAACLSTALACRCGGPSGWLPVGCERSFIDQAGSGSAATNRPGSLRFSSSRHRPCGAGQRLWGWSRR
jgi:hypothetical protein